MFNKFCLFLALILFISVAAPDIDESDNITHSVPDFAAGKNEIPPENPNSKIPANQPNPPVAKADSDIAIGNSAYADGSADGQAGAPSMAIGNAAVATGEGSVAIGSKAVSGGMGGVAIGDAAKQKNGGNGKYQCD